ncbi:hypothetical protein [uncultured Arthrobacter sp.]|uniref:hypothetical protein n=1 Tax=uncultured Arthrobacter sp. TaxID=114050 RepID=UPI003216C199
MTAPARLASTAALARQQRGRDWRGSLHTLAIYAVLVGVAVVMLFPNGLAGLWTDKLVPWWQAHKNKRAERRAAATGAKKTPAAAGTPGIKPHVDEVVPIVRSS